MVDYQIDGIEPDMSFRLDVFNEDLSNRTASLIMTVAKEFAECVLCNNGKHGPDRDHHTLIDDYNRALPCRYFQW
jgi:hypothetical protein